MSLITPDLITFARQTFKLVWQGIHGAPHWSRVRLNGLKLAAITGANPIVVEYFAFIHDLGRENDNYDPEHGHRGAEIAQDINGTLIQLDNKELQVLKEACQGHSDGYTMADVTVMTCWDADRLDLGRVGIDPDPDKLCTLTARRPRIMMPAFLRSIGCRGNDPQFGGFRNVT